MHPDHDSEQAYINHAYDCLDVMRERLENLADGGGDPKAAYALRRLAEELTDQYADAELGLCFGRLDMTTGDAHYIGRAHVEDSDRQPVVINWQAPAAAPFYKATQSRAMDVERRRHFRVNGRTLLDITDEQLAALIEVAPPVVIDLLLAELERSRTPEMRDIVTTITAEQHDLMSRPLKGILVVQGAPGTGKTAVGLHRASWLLFNYRRDLSRDGVLVVGPNRAFMQYISQVLPSLGDSAVDQSAVDHLVPGVRARGGDEVAVQRLKGDPRMAEVLQRALTARRRPPPEDVVVRHEGLQLSVPATGIETAASEALAATTNYIDARARFVDRFATLCYDAYRDARGARAPRNSAEVIPEMQRGRDFQNALDRTWPSLTSKQLVQELLAGPQRLEEAAAGILDDAERQLLRRGAARLEDVVWTPSDLPLLDEAEALLRGPSETYGHIILDEAQDLTPMQLRMVARRAPSGSMTVVGDIAQGTGVWHHATWEEILGYLPNGESGTIEELRHAYRVPRQIMELAIPLLAQIAPDVEPPIPYRDGKTEPAFVHVERDQLLPRLVEEVMVFSATAGTAGIIVPDGLVPDIRAALAMAQIEYGEALRDPLGPQLELVTPRTAKGLEFDEVVIVEPSRIVAEATTNGLRELYVALTRATQHLTVIHSQDLPEPLPRDRTSDDAFMTRLGAAGLEEPRDAVLAGEGLILSPVVTEAFGFARRLHERQWRKGSGTPYVAHLIGVAALVLEDGGSEDEAIAALLHDAAEDQGGETTLTQIRQLFGENIARIVASCTDTVASPKPPWRMRKEQFIQRLGAERDSSILRVVLADKLYNARSIVRDFRQLGEALWSRFDPESDQIWYYRSIVSAFRKTGFASPMLDELDRTVEDLAQLTG